MEHLQGLYFRRTLIHGSEEFVVQHFGGKYWDDIYYFPKVFQIGLLHKGKGTFTVGERTWNVAQGDIIFIPPNLVHKGKPNVDTGWEMTMINIAPQTVDRFMESEKLFSIFSDFTPHPECSTIFQQLLFDCEATTNLDEALQLVFAFLLECSTNIEPSEDKNTKLTAISMVREHIEKNYTKKISLEELADMACLSKFHFLRLFKQVTGLAPLTYQMHTRLNAARKLIFHERSLTELSHQLGFTDQAHFIRTYKKYAGITPNTFRKTAIFYNFLDKP